jgi:hypothetical protein
MTAEAAATALTAMGKTKSTIDAPIAKEGAGFAECLIVRKPSVRGAELALTATSIGKQCISSA